MFVVTLVKPEQPAKPLSPMVRTDDGITILVKLVPENALAPIVVTDVGIVTLVTPEQPLNAFAPILVTDDGIVRLVKLEQL